MSSYTLVVVSQTARYVFLLKDGAVILKVSFPIIAHGSDHIHPKKTAAYCGNFGTNERHFLLFQVEQIPWWLINGVGGTATLMIEMDGNGVMNRGNSLSTP